MPHRSFIINNDGGQLSLIPLAEKEMQAPVDRRLLTFYVASFRSIMYEGYDRAFDMHKADSVAAMPPYCIMTVKNKTG